MTSKMENPLWKKLQNDPDLLKQFTQHKHIGNGLENSNSEEISEGISKRNSCDEIESGNCSNNFKHNGKNSQCEQYNEYQNTSQTYNNTGATSFQKKQQNPIQNQSNHQQQQSNYAIDHQSQQLQQLINLKNYQEAQSASNELESQKKSHYYDSGSNNNGLANLAASEFYGDSSMNSAVKKRFPNVIKRELGLVEKLVGSYGFVKCLDREGRLFFHYSSFQTEDQASNGEIALKISDLVEFEEGIDRRNGKPVAVNITRFQQNSQQTEKIVQQQQSVDQFNAFNLNSLLKKPQHLTTDKTGQVNGQYDSNLNKNSDQQDYQTIMNGLKMLNIQSLKDKEQLPSVVGENRLNPAVMNLFNKENIFKNDLHQFNLNNNLLNMIKSASNSQAINAGACNDNDSNNSNSNNNISMNDNLSNLAKILNTNESAISHMDINKCPGNEQMEGTIAIVANKSTSHYNNRSNFYSPQLDGRITYQRSGETFYIPYSFYDVLPNSPTTMPSYSQIQLKIGDRVRFYIAQSLGNELNVPNGTYYAQRIELAMQSNSYNFNGANSKDLQAAKPVFRGIITTLKESFGKIEREDQFKETFFHFHEYIGKNPMQELKLGLNVEFELQDRYGKEIACNVKMLPSGTVSFDELSRDVLIGRIILPLTKISNLMHNTNLNGISLNEVTSIGKLVFDNEHEKLTELLFSDLDRLQNASGYTLLEGDFVQFRIVSDKRQRSFNNNTQMHRQKRATQLTLIEEHSLIDNIINTGEYRERGILVKFSTAKELLQNNDIHNSLAYQKYGAIKCLEQNELIYFSASEVINYVKFSITSSGVATPSVKEVDLQIGDSLEFSIVKCQKDPLFKNGLQAIRLQKLPENTVKFETISPEAYTGCIESETSTTYKNNTIDKHLGSIKFDGKSVWFDKSNNEALKIGDRVQFNVSTCLKTKKQLAVNLKLIELESEQGVITVLKDDYGLIESIHRSVPKKTNDKQQIGAQARLIFFHVNSKKDQLEELEVGDEVEYKINPRMDQKLCAESLIKLKNGTIKLTNMSQVVLKGRITQLVNPLDEGYYGKVFVTSSKKDNETSFEFGVYGNIKNKSLQVGDMVTFQLGSFQDGVKRAVNLQEARTTAQRNGNNSAEVKKGKIDSIKGHCGFIEYAPGNSPNEQKKVFFHISDLSEGGAGKSESSSIQIGDEVEFIPMHNPRTGKYSAIKIKKISTSIITSQLHHVSSSGRDLNEQLEQVPITKRPDHLITKLKIGNVCDINGKKLCLIRQPTKPDGKSFCRVLYERVPGQLESELMEFFAEKMSPPNEAGFFKASNLVAGLVESKVLPLTVME